MTTAKVKWNRYRNENNHGNNKNASNVTDIVMKTTKTHHKNGNNAIGNILKNERPEISKLKVNKTFHKNFKTCEESLA